MLQSRLQNLCYEVDSSNFQSIFDTSDALDTHPACSTSRWAFLVGSSGVQLSPQNDQYENSNAVASSSPAGLTPLLGKYEIKDFNYV